MALHSLNTLRKLRRMLVGVRRAWLLRVKGVQVHSSTSISLSSRFLAGRRGDIIIDAQSLVAFKTLIYTQDAVTGEHRPVRIGRHCFIGGGSIIGPGVQIGDGSIIGAGSVVMENVPPRSIVGGNPAKLLRSEAEVGPYGRLKGAAANTRQHWR